MSKTKFIFIIGYDAFDMKRFVQFIHKPNNERQALFCQCNVSGWRFTIMVWTTLKNYK